MKRTFDLKRVAEVSEILIGFRRQNQSMSTPSEIIFEGGMRKDKMDWSCSLKIMKDKMGGRRANA